jgi:hypothetical protein
MLSFNELIPLFLVLVSELGIFKILCDCGESAVIADL